MISLNTAATAISCGDIHPEALTRACLERISEREAKIGAWAFLDPQYALKQAQKADRLRRTGRDTGALHGVPIGVADLFDSKDMPCEWGSPLYRERRCGENAQVVSLLHAAGAVLPGKCATSELGLFTVGKTRHPQATDRPVLGGAAGAAAAVADGMLPAAVALQGEGDLIHAAAQCGIVGYVPSAGLISRRRAIPRSPTLDRVGVLARTLDDAALLAQTLMVYDDGDSGMVLQARPRLTQGVQAQPPVAPRFGVVYTPWWDEADEAMQASMGELVAALSGSAATEEFALGSAYTRVPQRLSMLFATEWAYNFSNKLSQLEQPLSAALQTRLTQGGAVLASDYLRVLDECQHLRHQLEGVFLWCDALITPAAHGAIDNSAATQSALFALPWQLLGLPTLTLPLFENEAGLPMGLQLVGSPLGDSRLLRTANWLLQQLVDTD